MVYSNEINGTYKYDCTFVNFAFIYEYLSIKEIILLWLRIYTVKKCSSKYSIIIKHRKSKLLIKRIYELSDKCILCCYKQ